MTTLSFRVARSLALVLFLGVVGGACGVGPDKGATDIPRSQVPFGLLERTEVEPVNTEPAEEVAALFFVKGDRLEPVFREVATEAAPAEVLEALLVGPTRAEFRSGLRTAVPEATSIGSVKVTRGVATVNLTRTVGDGRSDDQALSVAQMVFTLTARPGIGRVSFTIDGEPVDVPDGSGALTSDPVAREDYEDLAPPRR